MSIAGQQRIQVLHVDDEPDFADLTKTFLERQDDRFVVETVATADEGVARIQECPPDCVVSDYNMPGMDGLEFLRAVRAEYPSLPFILFTGKGSEEVASDAIAADVTDYLQKRGGTEQYELLANRVRNAVKQQQTAGQLRETQREYSAIFENAQNGLLLLAVEETGFRYQECNPRAVELIGRDRAQVVGNTPREALGPENGQKVVGAYRTCVEQRRPVEYVVTLDLPVGQAIRECEVAPVTADGDIEQLVVEFRDITERRRRKRELQEVKSQYQTLIKNFPDGAVFLFDTDLRYVQAGGQELSATGLSPEEVTGRTPHDLFPEAVADETARYYRETLAGASHTFEQEYRGERYRVRTVPVRSNGEGVTYGIAVSKNITDQTERRQKLERQNERLEEFTGIVSHDLRNPLTVAEGHLELAQETCESDALATAADAVDRSQALINDLLALAREGEEVAEVEPVTLADVAERGWQTVDTELGTLNVDVSRVVEADRSRLQQLFENLYRNNVEHGGADVTVSVGAMDNGFYVADTGPGIPDSEREAVFEAGYSTNEDGTGFGLRIVEQIADAHGWGITVTESDRGGARFEVTGVEFVDR
ncbi:MAG: PAS domain S-box-containing protein [Salinirussus sp.]|jgi:PAS domain S-box-containing protein